MNNTDTPNEIWENKVGYDSANKRMVAKVYASLYYIMEYSSDKPTWTNVIKHMLTMDNRLGKVSINGYYSTIRKNLKDIKVIESYKKGIVKGSNWDRFYSDEDWSWFITNTNSGGYGIIVK
jgi:hypothetical protein